MSEISINMDAKGEEFQSVYQHLNGTIKKSLYSIIKY